MTGSTPGQDLEAELDRIDADVVARFPGGGPPKTDVRQIAAFKSWLIANGDYRWTCEPERQRDLDRIASLAAELLAAREWGWLVGKVEWLARLEWNGRDGDSQQLIEPLPPEPPPPPPPPAPRTPRAGITPKQRLAVFKRDGYRCQVPGCENSDLVVDHLVALAKGGADEESNWQTLCSDHNTAKATRSWGEFLQDLTVRS